MSNPKTDIGSDANDLKTIELNTYPQLFTHFQRVLNSLEIKSSPFIFLFGKTNKFILFLTWLKLVYLKKM